MGSPTTPKDLDALHTETPTGDFWTVGGGDSRLDKNSTPTRQFSSQPAGARHFWQEGTTALPGDEYSVSRGTMDATGTPDTNSFKRGGALTTRGRDTKKLLHKRHGAC